MHTNNVIENIEKRHFPICSWGGAGDYEDEPFVKFPFTPLLTHLLFLVDVLLCCVQRETFCHSHSDWL